MSAKYADTVLLPALRARGVVVVDLRGKLPRNTTYPLVKEWATRPPAAVSLVAVHYDASPLRPALPYDAPARYAAEARAHIAAQWPAGSGYHAPTIAYHAKIDGEGVYYQLNDVEEITWNANDANGQDYAVCLDLGQGQDVLPAQAVTLQRTLDALCLDCAALPVQQSEVYGHGELTWLGNATSCPGAALPYVQRYRATGSVFDAVTTPLPPEVAKMLTDAELAKVAAAIWADGTVGNVPFHADFAIPTQWLAAYRAGCYLGAPISGETDVADGTLTYQEFQAGLVVYRKGDGYCSWKG